VAGGLVALAVGGQAVFRSYRAARRQARIVAGYAANAAGPLEALAQRLNEHGFELQHSSAELFPKVRRLLALVNAPLVAAGLPWLVRRLLGRPLRRSR